jgi:2-methylisocitrate lyase-like PEP mutase family enzyme
VPGVLDAETIGCLARFITGPLNVLARAGIPPVAELARLGVARISVGSGPMLAVLARLRRIAREILTAGTFLAMTEDAIPYAEMNSLIKTPVAQDHTLPSS